MEPAIYPKQRYSPIFSFLSPSPLLYKSSAGSHSSLPYLVELVDLITKGQSGLV